MVVHTRVQMHHHRGLQVRLHLLATLATCHSNGPRIRERAVNERRAVRRTIGLRGVRQDRIGGCGRGQGARRTVGRHVARRRSRQRGKHHAVRKAENKLFTHECFAQKSVTNLMKGTTVERFLRSSTKAWQGDVRVKTTQRTCEQAKPLSHLDSQIKERLPMRRAHPLLQVRRERKICRVNSNLCVHVCLRACFRWTRECSDIVRRRGPDLDRFAQHLCEVDVKQGTVLAHLK
jgi:hypothetical protein